jgi:hypothetical protein
MKEGQAVTFILRITPDSAKKEDEAHPAGTSRPTKDLAEELGVSMEKLVAAKSHLRPDGDPVITPVSRREAYLSSSVFSRFAD